MDTFPLALQTLYADLVQQAHAGLSDLGSIYVQTQKGTEYLYANTSVGVVRRHRFLGRADDSEAQAKAEAIRQGSKRGVERRKVVRILRSQGLPAPSTELGRVLDALADAGLFREAILVGTGAYQCYSALAGIFLPSAALMTQDADLATASLAISADESGATMLSILKRADPTFAPLPGLKAKALPSHFRSASGFVVDLLTPQRKRDDPNPLPLKGLAAGAAPLQHLRWLIEEPVRAVALHGRGIPIRVPAPARYAAHKLIVAQKRSAGEAAKRRKDLVQAKALIEALLASDPWSIRDAVEDARSQGKERWAKPIHRSLRELGLEAALLE